MARTAISTLERSSCHWRRSHDDVATFPNEHGTHLPLPWPRTWPSVLPQMLIVLHVSICALSCKAEHTCTNATKCGSNCHCDQTCMCSRPAHFHKTVSRRWTASPRSRKPPLGWSAPSTVMTDATATRDTSARSKHGANLVKLRAKISAPMANERFSV